jgi:hypothetical protein
MGGIEQLAETVATDMEQRLPGQRKGPSANDRME